jgi:hypothetical protein
MRKSETMENWVGVYACAGYREWLGSMNEKDRTNCVLFTIVKAGQCLVQPFVLCYLTINIY